MNQKMFLVNVKSIAVPRVLTAERQTQEQVKPNFQRSRCSFQRFTGKKPILQYNRNARCSASAQGQTKTREAPTKIFQKAPGKDKSLYLDDGGSGFPPRDDGGGGGGGGGGEGSYAGGFLLFGFLALLGLLKDMEGEKSREA